MISLDVIYVNFNSSKCLIKSIESLYHDKGKNHLQIIVVDNSSKDNPSQLKNLFPDIKLILNRENIGFGAAINQALICSLSKYIILLNPDSLVTEGFLEASIDYMEKSDRIGIMGPMILDEDGGVQGSARSFPTILTSLFGRNSPITKIFPNNSITRANILTNQSDGRTPIEVDWVSGACMVVQREAMQAVGGFDKRFFLYWEDTDLCKRIKDAGWKVVYFPAVKVIHSVGKSSNTRPIFANYQFHKSCYRLYEKYAKGPLSIFTPLAGIALMYRFLIAIFFNYLNAEQNKIQKIQKQRQNREEQKIHKIRILRIISRMNIGGTSVHVNNLTEYLNTNRFVTRLITGTVSPEEGDMAYITKFEKDVRFFIPELQREISPYHDLKSLFKVIKMIHCFNPDIIDSHTSKAGVISRTAALICNIFRRRKLITVHTFHGNVLSGYFGRAKSLFFLIIERLLARITDRIIAISQTQKWELLKKYKIGSSKKISIVKLGFNLEPFQSANRHKGALRKKLCVSDDTVLIGMVGRMAPIKNHRMFLEAGKQLIESQTNRKITLLLVGDGEERQQLEDYTDRLDIRENVVFYGWEENIAMIYADIDILALTSLNEGTPVSVIEAMASSVPVITTGVGGIKDLLGRIHPGQPDDLTFRICERGILCPKNDPITFAHGLNFMVDSNYLSEKHRFEKASSYVLKNYSMVRLINDMELLYAKLVA
jgi:GT2 family glycosyltransferase/glycosyltransferase involved in cell wall biosynthesis